jgi:hypothetical protein
MIPDFGERCCGLATNDAAGASLPAVPYNHLMKMLLTRAPCSISPLLLGAEPAGGGRAKIGME